jgi:hypothetical protein
MGAIVDLQTGKITGCVEGSKTWWHEKGHIEFNNTSRGASISYYQQFFMMTAVFFGCLSLVIPNMLIKLFAFLNALGMVLSYVYEECWAWVWGLKQYHAQNK